MVYEACKRDPSLAFCDSHILGKAPTERASTPQPTLPPSQDPFKEMRQWLEGFKDETDDDETENEKSRHLHEDKDQYCHKYYQNYRHYCFDDKETELEGVLNQFCDSFRVSCEGIIPGVTRPAPGISRNQPATDGQNGKGGVKPDKTEEYCKQFKPQYGSLCSSPTKQSAEFCQSYKDNCLKSSSDAKTVWPSSSTSAPDEGFLEESLPDTSSETEGAGSETSSRVAEYCEKYSENYNYYCVGDTSGDNDKFCNSFRKACPEKVHS